MTSKILELSQMEAQTVNKNGDYNISLPQNSDLLIQDGDSIQLKNVFIDTEQQSTQKIIIKEPITGYLEFMPYYTYIRTDELTTYNGASAPTPADVPIDGDAYIVCRDIGGANLSQLNSIKLFNNNPDSIIAEYEILYTDTQGRSHRHRAEAGSVIDPLKAFSLNFESESLIYQTNQSITLRVIGGYLWGTKEKLSPAQIAKVSISIQSETPVSTTAPHFEPVLNTYTFIIEKGNYSPELLTKEINRQLQRAGTSGEMNKYLEENPFLEAYGQSNHYLVRASDGAEIIQITGDLMIGASQVDLEFEPDTNQFSWNYIHMPYFTTPTATAPGQPAVGYITGNGTNTYFTVNKNSGIVFNQIWSEFSNGESAGLFTEILGFNNDDLSVKFSPKSLTNYHNVPTLTSIFITPDLEDGKNTTGGFIPLSAQVDRTSASWWKPAVENSPQSGLPFLSTSIDTFNILGSQNTISNTQFSYGYFLIEVSGNFKSNYYSNKSSPNIMAIVSRYYELNSFTSGGSDTSLIYTHQGDPITLSSFGVRIMKPDKTVADNLGENTTVFLQIIKGEPTRTN